MNGGTGWELKGGCCSLLGTQKQNPPPTGGSKTGPCAPGAQIENEYGFCGFNDKTYLQHLADTARASLGKEAVLFTTDPPNAVTMGGLYGDDVVSCAPLCA